MDPLDQDIDIEWGELDNIEKELNDSKSNDVTVTPKKSSVESKHINLTPKNSPSKNDCVRSPKTSPAYLKKIVTPTKSSSVKFNSSPSKSVQSLSVLGSSKSPSISPKICDIKKSISNRKIESPKKSLNFKDEDRTSVKTSFKRKISPTKTPENKKFKNESAPSPDTQVTIMIIVLSVPFYIVIKILGKWIYNRFITNSAHCNFYS